MAREENDVLMVEKAIKEAESYPTRGELLRSLPRPLSSRTLNTILRHLQSTNKIAYDGKRIIWTSVDNPKLKKLAKTSVRVR